MDILQRWPSNVKAGARTLPQLAWVVFFPEMDDRWMYSREDFVEDQIYGNQGWNGIYVRIGLVANRDRTRHVESIKDIQYP